MGDRTIYPGKITPGGNLMIQLSKNIAGSAKNTDSSGISQPIKVSYQLGEESINSNWRDLIAMLALSQIKEFNIKLKKADWHPSALAIVREDDKAINQVDDNDTQVNHEETYKIIYNYNESSVNPIYLGTANKWSLVQPIVGFNRIIANANIILPDIQKDKDACIAVGQYVYHMIVKGDAFLAGNTPHPSAQFKKSWAHTRAHLSTYLNDIRIYAANHLGPHSSPDAAFADRKIFDESVIIDGRHDNAHFYNLLGVTIPTDKDAYLSFFSALALNDLKQYNIKYRQNVNGIAQFVQILPDGSERTLSTQTPGMLQQPVMPWPNDLIFTADNSSAFECACVLSWMKVLKVKIKSDVTLADLSNKLDTLIGTIQQHGKISLLPDHTMAIPSDYFANYFAETINSGVNHLAFCIKAYETRFVYDADSSEANEIRENWIKVFYFLALRNIRTSQYSVNFKPSSSIIPEGKGCYVREPYNKLDMFFDNQMIAQSNIKILFNVPENAVNTIDTLYGKLGIYPFEEILISHYMRTLLENIEKSQAFKATNLDYVAFVNVVNSKINSIQQQYQNELRETGPLFWGKLYTIAEDETQKATPPSTLEFINYKVIDNVFEEKLMFIESSRITNQLIHEHAMAGAKIDKVYAVGSKARKNNSAFYEQRQIFLPLTPALRDLLLANLMQESNGMFERLAIDSIATLLHDDLDADNEYYEVTFKGRGSLPHVELKKRYRSKTQVKNTTTDKLGTVSIWPSHEIKNFKGYRTTHVVLEQTSDRPIFDKRGIQNILNRYENNPTDNTVEAGKDDDRLSAKIDAFKSIEYPRMVRFSAPYKKSETVFGMLLSQPKKTYAQSDIRRKVVISIDYGNSNSVVYYNPGPNDVPLSLNLNNVSGVYLTHDRSDSNQINMQEAKSRVFLHVPHGQEDGDADGDVFTTAFMYYGTHGAEFLIDGNLYPFTMEEILNGIFSTLLTYDKLYHGTKARKLASILRHQTHLIFNQMLQNTVIDIVQKWNVIPHDIEVRASYPAAFDDDKINDYQEIWNAVLADVKNDFSKNWNQGDIIFTGVTLVPESLCAARVPVAGYKDSFGNTPTSNAGDTLMVIDVGGGTTDVAAFNRKTGVKLSILGKRSFWFGASHIMSRVFTSDKKSFNNFIRLLFAVRHALIVKAARPDPSLPDDNPLKLKHQLFFGEGIFSSETAITNDTTFVAAMNTYKSDNNISQINGKKLGLLLQCIKSFEDLANPDPTLGRKTQDTESTMRFMLEIILKNFEKCVKTYDPDSTLECYAVKKTAEFHRNQGHQSGVYPDNKDAFREVRLSGAALFFTLGAFAKLCDEENNIKQLLIAGNGSKMLNWIDAPNNYNTDTDFLLACYGEGMGKILHDTKVFFSTQPKHEAAKGGVLLSEDEIKSYTSEDKIISSSAQLVHDVAQKIELRRFLTSLRTIAPNDFIWTCGLMGVTPTHVTDPVADFNSAIAAFYNAVRTEQGENVRDKGAQPIFETDVQYVVLASALHIINKTSKARANAHPFS
jgi:hypothetical protein